MSIIKFVGVKNVRSDLTKEREKNRSYLIFKSNFFVNLVNTLWLSVEKFYFKKLICQNNYAIKHKTKGKSNSFQLSQDEL